MTKNYAGGVTPLPLTTTLPYDLELAPVILPNAEPRTLPESVIIDRDHCQPPSWRNGTQLDILFSPRGTVIGNAAAYGHIHLLITDLTDASGAGHTGPGSSKEFAETIITVTTQTGSVSTHSVFSTADPFRNAESGVETR